MLRPRDNMREMIIRFKSCTHSQVDPGFDGDANITVLEADGVTTLTTTRPLDHITFPVSNTQPTYIIVAAHDLYLFNFHLDYKVRSRWLPVSTFVLCHWQ